MAHTPGPWRFVTRPEEHPESDEVQWGVLEGGNDQVIWVSEGPVVPSKDDARLIAAAPEMLALLEDAPGDRASDAYRDKWLTARAALLTRIKGG